MRLFTAIPIAVESSLAAAIKKTKINAQRKEIEFNWVPDANFHVTLNFLGDTPAERLPELVTTLTAVAGVSSPIETSLRGMGGFPDDRHMRVLWVGVRKSRGLSELHERFREALVNAGFPQEERDYAPHLTVARTRKARTATDLISPFVRTSFGDLVVREVVLFESALQNGHPVYKSVNRFPLLAPPLVES